METRFKKLYDYMLENGELRKVYRSMSGDWEKDKDRFITAQKALEQIVDFKIEDEEHFD